MGSNEKKKPQSSQSNNGCVLAYYLNKITDIMQKMNRDCRNSKEQKEDILHNEDYRYYYNFGYRGEPKEYPNPGMPSIFREKQYKKDPYYERNILEELQSYNLCKDSSNYLHLAIHAQHLGFPTRLLDITFNMLIGLFFACTPHFTHKEDKYDDEDGIFIIYGFKNNIQSAYSKSLSDQFSEIINNPKKLRYCTPPIVIDHVQLNERISIQQGGLILFPSDKFYPLSPTQYRVIKIKKEDKKKLRKELKLLFNIHIGSIYPEADHMIEEIKKRSANIGTEDEFGYYYSILEDIDNHLNNSYLDECRIYVDQCIKEGTIKKEERNEKIKKLKVEKLWDINDYLYHLKDQMYTLSKLKQAEPKLKKEKFDSYLLEQKIDTLLKNTNIRLSKVKKEKEK